ncbi:hypothetical protein NicSoilE8_41440 (plasmid) [Arthrobacter sp. NicSoilE8]|nr:hypothetical protein NicSoilE8_41440 [Arthrobacter sp. NicSoilE8]
MRDRHTGGKNGAAQLAQYAVPMQVREATMDDLGHANAICDASERTRWTSEMIALIPLGMGYEANMPPTALDVIEAWGGNMVILTQAKYLPASRLLHKPSKRL